MIQNYQLYLTKKEIEALSEFAVKHPSQRYQLNFIEDSVGAFLEVSDESGNKIDATDYESL